MSDAFPHPPPSKVVEAALLVKSWAATQVLAPHWELCGLTPSTRVRELETKLAIKHSDLCKCNNLREIATDAYLTEKAHREMLETLLAARRAAPTPGDDAIMTGGEG